MREKKARGRERHSTIWLHFAGIVFAAISLMFIFITVIWFLLFKLDLIAADPHGRKAPLLLFLTGSLLLGGLVAIYVGKVIIMPIKQIGKAFHDLSQGNFSVRVSEDGKIREMREIGRQFNAMAHDLSNIETLRCDFVANVSHEIKTPLSSIEGYATLLQNPALSNEKREYYAQKILDNSKKLSEMTSNILLLSKLDNQEIVIGKSEFRLDEQIRRTILMLEDRWSAKIIEFDMDLQKQMYLGNEPLLERVWSNLIDNAIKHSHEGGIIRIETEQTEDEISVIITDYGDGMSDEVKKHIFEKFYQGDRSRSTEGNGLGLALVRRIIQLCDGEISVESTLGAGSTFKVTLPTSR